MNADNSAQPDALAKGTSHVVVGVAGAAIVTYVLVGLLGMRKASPSYQLLAAGIAIWVHAQMDLPVAQKLSAAGL